MEVLITGITGFVGSHLADFLLGKKGIKAHGIVRRHPKTENIEYII
ncbi:MAG: NAD-dependent epimerase/dehydratase family protein [Candidatus Omnitrophica bacterium]|nr:NAD-dependent epimerase/dehydratase family protein [Candidatus Omnitrophota bacterium]